MSSIDLTSNILNNITSDLKPFLTQKMSVREVKYNIQESTTGDKDSKKQVPTTFTTDIGSEEIMSVTFFFDIFSEVLEYRVSQNYDKGIDETFLKKIKSLGVLTNFSLVNSIQNKFYQKYITPMYKTKVSGKDLFNVKIPIYTKDISNIKELQKLISVKNSNIFATKVLQLKTNNYVISFEFLNGKIKIYQYMIEGVTFEIDSNITQDGKLFKQFISISSKQLYMEVPKIQEGSTNVEFLNGSNYIFSI